MSMFYYLKCKFQNNHVEEHEFTREDFMTDLKCATCGGPVMAISKDHFDELYNEAALYRDRTRHGGHKNKLIANRLIAEWNSEGWPVYQTDDLTSDLYPV